MRNLNLQSNKQYESDKNNRSIEEADSLDEQDHNSFDSPRDLAGYNFQNQGQESQRGEVDEAELFSSDEELQKKGCFTNSMKALGSCLVGQGGIEELKSSEDFKKPKGLFGEKTFKQVCFETQKKSKYGQNKNYGLISVIVKSPDNLTQEQFASQLIKKFMNIFKFHNSKLWLKPFNIIATCPTGGLIETIPDAVSINQLKKENP